MNNLWRNLNFNMPLKILIEFYSNHYYFPTDSGISVIHFTYKGLIILSFSNQI